MLTLSDAATYLFAKHQWRCTPYLSFRVVLV
nr:MAG TPA: hypothetical protein [Caudoviricetes sp.]